jgi:hypothetical protein
VEVVGVFGVVEDQQPVATSAELGAQRGDGHGLVAVLGDAELAGQGDQLGGDGGGLLGRDPPADRVVAGVAVGVLQGKLGLADPTQAVQHLRRRIPVGSDGGGRVGGQRGDRDRRRRGGRGDELLAELVEQLSTAGEGTVARGQVRDRRG